MAEGENARRWLRLLRKAKICVRGDQGCTDRTRINGPWADVGKKEKLGGVAEVPPLFIGDGVETSKPVLSVLRLVQPEAL